MNVFYVGILSNKGKCFENDAEALSHAFESCGIEPAENWITVNDEFEEFLLGWYFSSDWDTYRTREEYEAEQEPEPTQEQLDEYRRKERAERAYYDADQIRRGCRL